MFLISIAAFACSAFAVFAVIASSHRHGHWSHDHDLDGPQKIHVRAVPRVGGVGILSGLLGGLLVFSWLNPGAWKEAALLVACALPAFLSGIWEDFTKAISPRRRMVALALSGLLGVLLLGGSIVRSGFVPFDRAMIAAGLLWLGSVGAVFAVTGIANSINIIDGMNGLSSMCVALMMVALAHIAWRVGDSLVLGVAVASIGATLGFFAWNFPRGLIFLGDGGAYLLGFLVAELGILLTARHPEVSMLAPLLLVAYPVFETLFSMYRRRIIQRRPMTAPDGIHLHTLIYRRLQRGTVDSRGVRDETLANSRTSPYLWLLSLVAVAPATLWWDNSAALAASLAVFVAAYLYIYWRIVTFRPPRWMKLRRERRAEALRKF